MAALPLPARWYENKDVQNHKFPLTSSTFILSGNTIAPKTPGRNPYCTSVTAIRSGRSVESYVQGAPPFCFLPDDGEIVDHSEDRGVNEEMGSEWILVGLAGGRGWSGFNCHSGRAGSCECDDEPSGSSATEWVNWYGKPRNLVAFKSEGRPARAVDHSPHSSVEFKNE
jgi:hypothetical protein